MEKNWDFPSGLWSTSTCCSQLKLIALAIPRFFRGHFSHNADFRSPRGERERTSRSRGLTWPRHFQLVRRTKKPSPVQKPLPRLCDAIFFFFSFCSTTQPFVFWRKTDSYPASRFSVLLLRFPSMVHAAYKIRINLSELNASSLN